jgi:hypothetical protein
VSDLAVDLYGYKEQLEDQLWRLNNLYYIIDKAGKRVKFQMNTSQERFYREMWYRTICLKARQRGFTTLIDLFALDTAVFNPNYAAGIIAHTREDAEKIFQTKVKYPYENLPEAIRSAIPASSDRAREYRFGNNSSVSVSTSFRSGTLQLLHVSEMGKIAAKYPDKAKEIKTGAFEAVPTEGMIIVESTAEGRSGAFYDLVEDARKQEDAGKPPGKLDFKFFFEPWWKNPEYKVDADGIIINPRLLKYFETLQEKEGVRLTPKQKAWYVAKEKVLGGDMLREYPSTADEAFKASIEGAYFKRQMAEARRSNRITKVPHRQGNLVTTWWDIGGDGTSIWFTQDVGMMVHVIDFYHNSNEGLDHYKEIMDEWADEKGYRYAPCKWPHDMGDRVWVSSGHKTKHSIAIEKGMKGDVLPQMDVKSDGIEAARDFFSICVFDEENCIDGLAALDAYRKEWDDRLGTWKEKPLHDWASHPADAFQQLALYHEFAVAKQRARGKAKKVKKKPAGGWT